MNPATRRRLPSLWIPFALALFGGAIAASSASAAGRCTGIALVTGGALYLLRWQWVVSRPNPALEMLEIENQSLRARTEMETQRRLDILANLRDGVILLGAGQQVQLFNPAAQLMLAPPAISAWTGRCWRFSGSPNAWRTSSGPGGASPWNGP